ALVALSADNAQAATKAAKPKADTNNVTVTTQTDSESGDTQLLITGDSLGNAIIYLQISPSLNVVIGVNGTTVNGSPLAVVNKEIKSISISMLGGSDAVGVVNVPEGLNDFSADGGDASDAFISLTGIDAEEVSITNFEFVFPQQPN